MCSGVRSFVDKSPEWRLLLTGLRCVSATASLRKVLATQCTRSTRHDDANPCTGRRPLLCDWGTIGQRRFRIALVQYLKLPLVCPELSKLQKVGLVNSNAIMWGPSKAPAAIIGAGQVVLCLNASVMVAWWGFAGLNLACL